MHIPVVTYRYFVSHPSYPSPEGLSIEPNAAEALVEQAGNDIRQTLHATQMWRARSSSMRYAELKDSLQRIEKDKILRQVWYSDARDVSALGKASPDKHTH